MSAYVTHTQFAEMMAELRWIRVLLLTPRESEALARSCAAGVETIPHAVSRCMLQTAPAAPKRRGKRS